MVTGCCCGDQVCGDQVCGDQVCEDSRRAQQGQQVRGFQALHGIQRVPRGRGFLGLRPLPEGQSGLSITTALACG